MLKGKKKRVIKWIPSKVIEYGQLWAAFWTNTFMAGFSKVVKNWKEGNVQYIFTEWNMFMKIHSE